MSVNCVVIQAKQELQKLSTLYSHDLKLIEQEYKGKKRTLTKLVYSKNDLGFSPIHFSIASGFHDISDFYLSLMKDAYMVKTDIIKKGINSKYRVYDEQTQRFYFLLSGMSIVDIAAKRGDFETVKKLLASSYKLSKKTNKNYSTLMYAVESLNDQVELVKWLVAKGQKVDISWQKEENALIFLAAQANNTKITKWLFNKLSNVKKGHRYQMSNGLTPLYYALGNKNKKLSHYLIKHLKTPKAIFKPLKFSLLHKAVSWGRLDIIDDLIQAGVPHTNIDRYGRDFFQHAVVKGKNDLVIHLIKKHDFKVNNPKHVESVLALSLRFNRPLLALDLIKRGAKVEEVNAGDPLLKIAVSKRYYHVAKEMIKHKASKMAKDKKGITVQEYAKKSKDSHIRSLF